MAGTGHGKLPLKALRRGLTYQVYQRIVRLILTECDSVPDVPVRLLGLVGLQGRNDGLPPPGRPEADKPPLPPKPLCGLTVIVLVPLVPWVIVTLLGDAERLKFCWPAALTVRLTVVE